METIQLRGLAWDHRRCWGPLEASVGRYSAANPGITIRWDRRSLWEFGEGRLEGPAEDYDLVIYDHPFVGEAARKGLMVDLSTLLSTDQAAVLAADSLGPSWQSYGFDGGVWALPIDGAAQVAAYRPDLLSRYAAEVPRTLDEVIALGEAVRADDRYIAWPSIPVDVMCTVLTVAAGMGYRLGGRTSFLAADEIVEVMSVLRRLRTLAHPLSERWNPIACYDHMAAADDVVYVPYAFGYVNYTTPASGSALGFADIPRLQGGEVCGALLGGTGIGISARSPHARAAFDYAMFLCDADYQAGDYVRHGGQPGNLRAWTDPAADAVTGGFFSGTRQSLITAYLRPNAPGFIDFFRAAAQLTSRNLADADRTDDRRLSDDLNRLYEASLVDAADAA